MMVYTRTNEIDKFQNTTNVAVIWIVMMVNNGTSKANNKFWKHDITGSYYDDGIHQNEWNKQVLKRY